MDSTVLSCHNLALKGPLGYAEGLALQTSIHDDRVRGLCGDTVLFLEHSPVVSLGRRGESADILAGHDELARRGVVVHTADRGGQVTFHGPGQLVVYCMVHLGSRVRQVRSFVEGIEEAVRDYLGQRYGIGTWLEDGHPGIWTAGGKVAAVGISLKDRVSMHGLALNLQVDPSWFRMIVPCGIRDRPAVSVADLGAAADSPARAALDLAPLLAARLGYESLVWCS